MNDGPPRRESRTRRAARAVVVVLGLYVGLAYLVLPALWEHHEHHPMLAAAPRTTVNAQGIPGDPLDVGLIGERAEVVGALVGAGWHPADPITLHTSLEIAGSVLLDRPYADAPVSSLYLFGRVQDLAFEQLVGQSARERHHVRLWRADGFGVGGRPLWLGAATFDRSVGLSHLTGQVTHHIAADIDAERDRLIDEIERAGWLTTVYQVTGVGPTLDGRNAGGDRYVTDGELTVGVLATAGAPARPAIHLPNPPLITVKQRLWPWVRRLAGA